MHLQCRDLHMQNSYLRDSVTVILVALRRCNNQLKGSGMCESTTGPTQAVLPDSEISKTVSMIKNVIPCLHVDSDDEKQCS